MAKIISIIIFVTLAFGLQAQKTLLFNGSFENWTFGYQDEAYDSSLVWQVKENGELYVLGKGFKQSGMRTNKKYGDYILTLEYKWLGEEKHGNSGIWIHGQDNWSRAGGAFPTSIEVQLRKGYAGDLLRKGLEINEIPGAPSEGEAVMRNSKEEIVEHLHTEWNTVKIKCVSDTIDVWPNGIKVNRAANCRDKNNKSVTKGYITLQAERWNLVFRNIYIEEL